jgi:hypothetical protein
LKTTSTVIAGATLAARALVGKPALPGDSKAEGRMVPPNQPALKIQRIFCRRHVFVDFEGHMTASTVWIRVVRLGGTGHAGPCPIESDARILRHKLKRNIVRASHHPQSRHFVITFDS